MHKSTDAVGATVTIGEGAEIRGGVDVNGLVMLTGGRPGYCWWMFGSPDSLELLADAIQTVIEYRRLHAGKTPKADLDAMRKYVADEMFGRRIEAQQEGCPQTA